MLPISICMIAKNEEKYIGECLRRLSLLDWEIIVVDTGSTDSTVEIAKSYTPNVYHFDWINDFSAARNYSISMATNDYILVIDCDEFLENTHGLQAELENLLNHADASRVGLIDLYSTVCEGDTPSQVHQQIARFFHRKRVRYEGIVHEQLVSMDGLPLTFTPIPVSFQHMGYSTLPIKEKKASRNISLLNSALDKEPSNPYLLFQLGQTYFGLENYAAALPYFEKALEQDVNEQEDYVQTMVESYGYCLLHLKQYSRALELEGIYSIFSKHADFVFLMGLIYMNNAYFDRAIKEFTKATTINTYSVDGVNSYKAFYNIGVICECMGHKQKANIYYRKCGDYTPALDRLQN